MVPVTSNPGFRWPPRVDPVVSPDGVLSARVDRVNAAVHLSADFGGSPEQVLRTNYATNPGMRATDGEVVVATNLMPDPSFEHGTRGWFTYTGSTLALDESRAHSGSRSLHCSGGTAAAKAQLAPTLDAGTFTFSAWLWVPSGSASSAQLRFQISGGATVDSPFVSVRDQWQQVSVTSTVPAGATVALYVRGATADCEFWVDDAGLVAGASPVDFSGATNMDTQHVYRYAGTKMRGIFSMERDGSDLRVVSNEDEMLEMEGITPGPGDAMTLVVKDTASIMHLQRYERDMLGQWAMTWTDPSPVVAQGIAWADPYWFAVEGQTLIKYDATWSYVTSRNMTSDVASTMTHFSAPLAKDGYIYVPIKNDPATIVGRWRQDDLSFVDSSQVTGAPDMASAAIAWDEGASEFLIVGYYDDENTLARYDANLNYLGSIPTGLTQPQGVAVIGDRIYLSCDSLSATEPLVSQQIAPASPVGWDSTVWATVGGDGLMRNGTATLTVAAPDGTPVTVDTASGPLTSTVQAGKATVTAAAGTILQRVMVGLGPYFDGSTGDQSPGPNETGTRWTGPVDASTSEQYRAGTTGLDPLPLRVRFYRDAPDGPVAVRSGAPAWAPGGVAVAYDYEAPLSQGVSYRAVPIMADGSEGEPSDTITLEVDVPVKQTWIKCIADPDLSLHSTAGGVKRPIIVEPVSLSSAGRVGADPIAGSRFPAATWDVHEAVTGDMAVNVWTVAQRDQLLALLDAGPFLVQAPRNTGIDDLYALAGDITTEIRTYRNDVPVTRVSFSVTGVGRPSPVDTPLRIPGLSYASIAADYATYKELSEQVASYKELVGVDW